MVKLYVMLSTYEAEMNINAVVQQAEADAGKSVTIQPFVHFTS